MNHTKVLLLDFDLTLTKYHTTGALCFSNQNFDNYLNPHPLFTNDLALSENSCADPLFLYEKLQNLVDKGVCIAIITMADKRHAIEREKQLKTEQLKSSYHVLAGRDLVMRWFCSIIMKASQFDSKLASERIKRLFETNQICIVAKFTENSKQQHFAEAMRIFESLNVLVPHNIQPDQIVYADDSAQMLVDMQQALPGIHTILVVGGLNETRWQNILEKF